MPNLSAVTGYPEAYRETDPDKQRKNREQAVLCGAVVEWEWLSCLSLISTFLAHSCSQIMQSTSKNPVRLVKCVWHLYSFML